MNTNRVSFTALKNIQLLVTVIFLLITLLQTGCATMSLSPLKFDKHNLVLSCYSANEMEVIYRNTRFSGGRVGKICRAKQLGDDNRLPSGISGPKGYYDAFESPLKVQWRSLDGTKHSIVLDLDEIFKDRIVRHNEDPKRVDHVNSRNPDIVVEVNDRTINLYMDVWVSLYPTETSKRALNRHRTLIYSKIL